MNCRICDAPSLKLYGTKNGYDVLKCPNCGFGQVPVTQEQLNKIYSEAYWKGDATPQWTQTENSPISSSYRYWLEWQLSLFPKGAPIRVLEIGPGLGGMMPAYLQEKHPEVEYEAIEISEYAAENLAKRGFTIHTGGITTPSIVEACRGRFDLVIGTEVIEHDPDPHAFAAAVRTVLKPGGWCAFTTGNIDGWMARWNKLKWYYLDPPFHVSYYTPKAFRMLFEGEGFDEISAKRYGFNYINWKLKTHIPGILLLSHITGMSTGMCVRAHRK